MFSNTSSANPFDKLQPSKPFSLPKKIQTTTFSSWLDEISHATNSDILKQYEFELATTINFTKNALEITLKVYDVTNLTITKYEDTINEQNFNKDQDIILLYKNVQNLYNYFFLTGKNLVLSTDGSVSLGYNLQGQMGLVSKYKKLQLKQIEIVSGSSAQKQFIKKFKLFMNQYYAPKQRNQFGQSLIRRFEGKLEKKLEIKKSIQKAPWSVSSFQSSEPEIKNTNVFNFKKTFKTQNLFANPNDFRCNNPFSSNTPSLSTSNPLLGFSKNGDTGQNDKKQEKVKESEKEKKEEEEEEELNLEAEQPKLNEGELMVSDQDPDFV